MIDCSDITTLPIVNFVIDGRLYPLSGKDYVLQRHKLGIWCSTVFKGNELLG